SKRADAGDTGPWRGFDYSVQALHGGAAVVTDRGGKRRVVPLSHYGRWLEEHHPEHLESFGPLLSGEGGGDTGAPEARNNAIPRGWYHTDWIADLVVSWLDSLGADDDWFCWMSFPDPHHPWDPPASELHRVPWKELDLPAGHPGSDEAIRQVLGRKPAHWLAWWEGRFSNQEGGHAGFVQSRLSHDQIREVNAKTHVMNELIDEALGRVMATIAQRGWEADTDVVFTTDHGELQGDFGLLFKGPYHTDALMRLPLVWRPAPSVGVEAAEILEPVGQVDFAATFCEIAGVPQPEWLEGSPLPTAPGSRRERVLCEWDSQFPSHGMHMRSIRRGEWLCTAYEPSTVGMPNGLEKVWGDRVLRSCGIEYDGSEGELYDVVSDPLQFHNLWDDAGYRQVRADLVADLYDSLPKGREVALEVESPA
ncbi:MAG: sulfatase-like hydrolase/transferase, partial [Acidimicrobiales bacterium]